MRYNIPNAIKSTEPSDSASATPSTTNISTIANADITMKSCSCQLRYHEPSFLAVWIIENTSKKRRLYPQTAPLSLLPIAPRAQCYAIYFYVLCVPSYAYLHTRLRLAIFRSDYAPSFRPHLIQPATDRWLGQTGDIGDFDLC